MAELISSFIASVTMRISPWVPSFMALGSLLLCFILLYMMPQPSRSKRFDIGSDNVEEVSTSTADTEGLLCTPESPAKRSLVKDLKAAASNRNILLVIPVFLVGIFRYTTLDVLIQYASNRFGLKISTGAIFYTETAAINIALFLFIIPQGTAYLRNEHQVSPQKMDLFLARGSVFLMCIGSLAIAVAPTGKILPFGESCLAERLRNSSSLLIIFSGVAIFAGGFGSRVSALSLVSYWSKSNHRHALFNCSFFEI